MIAPDTVQVTYRNVNGVHTFKSNDVPGMYVADKDIRRAYELVAEGLSEFLQRQGYERAAYQPVMSVDEFIHWMNGREKSAETLHPSVIEAQGVAYRAVSDDC